MITLPRSVLTTASASSDLPARFNAMVLRSSATFGGHQSLQLIQSLQLRRLVGGDAAYPGQIAIHCGGPGYKRLEITLISGEQKSRCPVSASLTLESRFWVCTFNSMLCVTA